MRFGISTFLCRLPISADYLQFNLDFYTPFNYNKRELGGIAMNEFEQNVQSKRNDAIDAGMGFVVSFVFFAAIFIIAAVVQFVAR